METQVKEGVIYINPYEEVLNKARSYLMAYKAEPALTDSKATLTSVYEYKVSMDFDYANDKRVRTLVAPIFVDSQGKEIIPKGGPMNEVPFSVEYKDGPSPSEDKVKELAKKELPSSAELLNFKVLETNKRWYPSSFTFMFAVGITTAIVTMNGQVKVNIDPLTKEAIMNVVKSEFNLDDQSKVQVNENLEGYTVTYNDDNWNGVLKLNKVGVVTYKDLKISQKKAISIAESKVKGKTVLVKGEFTVYLEDENDLSKCNVDPHTGDANCSRIGMASSKVKDIAESFFYNTMLSNPTSLDVEPRDDGWYFRGSAVTGKMEFLVRHDGTQPQVNSIVINQNYAELWGKKTFPECELNVTTDQNVIRVYATDGNFEHFVNLSLDGKVTSRLDKITDDYAKKLAYNVTGQSGGCSERVEKRSFLIVDLLCNGRHSLVKMTYNGEIKEVMNIVDKDQVMKMNGINNVVFAGYKGNEITVKTDEGSQFRYVQFSSAGMKVKEDTCGKNFLSKMKCSKLDSEYKPKTQDPVDLMG